MLRSLTFVDDKLMGGKAWGRDGHQDDATVVQISCEEDMATERRDKIELFVKVEKTGFD